MHRRIVDVLDRARGITRGLAVVIHLRASDCCAGVVSKRPVTKIARQAYFDPVGILQQRAQLRGRWCALICEGIRVGKESGSEALHPLVGKRAATANTVANAIVECANAVAKEILLAGVDSQRVVGHLAKIKTLAV